MCGCRTAIHFYDNRDGFGWGDEERNGGWHQENQSGGSAVELIAAVDHFTQASQSLRGLPASCLICKAATPLCLCQQLNILTSQSSSSHPTSCIWRVPHMIKDHGLKAVYTTSTQCLLRLKIQMFKQRQRTVIWCSLTKREGFSLSQVPEDHGDMDDSSEKTPSKASKSPQKTTKRPKTVPVKVNLLDGSDYETAVEVWYLLCCKSPRMKKVTVQSRLKKFTPKMCLTNYYLSQLIFISNNNVLLTVSLFAELWNFTRRVR